MKTIRRILPLSALVAAGLLMMAAKMYPADAPDGADIFKKQACVMCHGQDGKGNAMLKTPDFTDPKWQAGITDQQIADTIKNGKPNTMMKPFGDKLSDDEIQALVKFIRAFDSSKKK